VYVGSNDGYVYALNASNGKRLWRYRTGLGVYPSPAVSDGVVCVGSDIDQIYAFALKR
jgi:outer membrane protein assembly factor BamB